MSKYLFLSGKRLLTLLHSGSGVFFSFLRQAIAHGDVRLVYPGGIVSSAFPGKPPAPFAAMTARKIASDIT